MATSAFRTLVRITRAIIGWAAAALGIFAAAIALVSWIGSSIPRNNDWQQPEDGVEIMVETNGVHTALVLPLVTPEKDWRTVFPVTDIQRQNRPYTHISVSWGEKQVFLETETWWDLKPSTVLRIFGFGGDGLVHVVHYARPRPDEDLRVLRISREAYRRIVQRVESFAPEPNTPRYPGYYGSDIFYDAPGRYTPWNTCNQWTSDTLAHAGIRTGAWTPMAGGVMKWVPETEED